MWLHTSKVDTSTASYHRISPPPQPTVTIYIIYKVEHLMTASLEWEKRAEAEH